MNNSEKQTYSSSGIGFGGALAIVFITLKLCGVISWSWLWVLSPLWIPLAIGFSCIGFCLLMAGIMAVLAATRNRKYRK